jgi:cobalt-zinc-cadmium efflux system outer membrane protein
MLLLKHFMAILVFTLSLEALSYDAFIKKALKNNPDLSKASLMIERSIIEGDISTRLINPNFELELSKIDEISGKRNYRTAITQEISLVRSQKQDIANIERSIATSKYNLYRAKYIYALNLAYSDYIYSYQLYQAGLDATKITKYIYTIAQKKYNQGSIVKAQYLQAKLDYKEALASDENRKLTQISKYYNLLELANITYDIKLSFNHKFKLSKIKYPTPTLKIILEEQQKAKANIELYKSSVESITIFTEIERDGIDDSIHIGVEIPLPIFNQKKQERQLAKLTSYGKTLEYKSQQNKEKIQLKRLKKQYKILRSLEKKNREFLKENRRLLEIYQISYRLAKSDLLHIQSAKIRLNYNNERLILLKHQLNQNIITQNFLLGAYNE